MKRRLAKTWAAMRPALTLLVAIASGALVRDRRGSRPIQPDDIAVLFRSRAGHRVYEDALDRRGVRTYVYKGLGFFDADETKDLMALLWYLAEPFSDRRTAAVLRSRFFAVSDDALQEVRSVVGGILVQDRDRDSF